MMAWPSAVNNCSLTQKTGTRKVRATEAVRRYSRRNVERQQANAHKTNNYGGGNYSSVPKQHDMHPNPKTARTLTLCGWALATALCEGPANGITLIDQPLRADTYGWVSVDGEQQIAEPFSTPSAVGVTNISWSGMFPDDTVVDSSVGDFKILLFADSGGLPLPVELVSMSLASVSGADTGFANPTGGGDWREWSVAIPTTLLGGPANYWVSILGPVNSSFIWAQGPTGGDGSVVSRNLLDSGEWQSYGVEDRDTQAVRIDASDTTVPEPSAVGIMGLGIGLLAWRRKRIF
jgi:hypothetical protein